jgi:hypothetical protein
VGIFHDRQIAYVIDARVEVTGSVTLLGGKFQLLVRGEQVDAAACNIGKSVTLRARLLQDGVEKQLEVHVSQGWLGTRFRLLVDGQPHRLHQAY